MPKQITNNASAKAAIQAALMHGGFGKALGAQNPKNEIRGNKMLKLEMFFDPKIHRTAFDQTKDIRTAVFRAREMIASTYGPHKARIELVWRWKDAWAIPVCNKGTEHPIAVISAVTYSDKLSITALKTAERMEAAPIPRVKTPQEIFDEFIGYVEMVEERRLKRRSR